MLRSRPRNENTPLGLEGLGEVMLRQGAPEQAGWLWGAAEGLRQVAGSQLPPAYHSAYEQAVAKATGETFAKAWTEGRTTLLKQVIDEALRRTS